jgi:hypothetical protein
MVYDHSDFLQTLTVLGSILILVLLTVILYKFMIKNMEKRSGSKIYGLLAITFLGNFIAKIVFIDFEIIFLIDIYLFCASVHGSFMLWLTNLLENKAKVIDRE